MQNTDYKNLTEAELFVIMDEKNFFESTHFENMKQLVKIDSEFKERFLKIRSDLFLLSNLSAESDSFKVTYQNLKSRGIL